MGDICDIRSDTCNVSVMVSEDAGEDAEEVERRIITKGFLIASQYLILSQLAVICLCRLCRFVPDET